MHFDWIASPGNYDFYIKVQVKNYYCADNSNTLQSKTIEKTVLNGPITFTNGNSGHTTHSYTSQVVKPTCTEEGYTLYTCSECGASYKDNYVAANGHSWNDRDYVITVEPTCETPGEGGYRCFWCDAILPVTLASKGHSWNSGTVTTAATCEKSGVKTYTCTVCKTTKTETIAALGHSYKETKITGSCTQRPGTKYDCTRCGNSYTAWDEASWSSWSTEKPSGYTGGDIESATQYRYRDKDTTTSSSASIEGVKTYTCTACKQTRTEVIPALPITYTVSYDANGGSGAPASQTKTKDVALTLSSTKPTRTGYTFLGWAASKTATSAQYQPGGSYTANAPVTLYAVWKENAPTYATTLTVSSATASQGKEVSLNISLAGNPGIIGINFQITYDKTRLKLIGYTDGAMKDWSVGIGESEKAIWIDEAADVINGNILTLKFQVLDNAPDGLAEVTVTGFKAAALDESAVNANIVAGGVTVTSRIPGDVNDDGEVDIFDCVRLKKYLAGFNVTINASNADVNGDGEVDIFDCVRLKKYLAGMSVELK